MFITKFYESDIADAGGGSETVVADVITPAMAMAMGGKKSDENDTELEPFKIPEKKVEEKPVVEETPAAKVEENQKAEKPTSETPQEKPVDENKKEETTPIAEVPAKIQTLEEVLKTNQPEAIFKALGFDDEKVALIQDFKDIDPKLVGIIQSWKEGTLGNYVKELATDYSKMEPEDLMRHQLRLDYPKATPRQLEILYKKEIVEKYNLDSVDEDEAAEGRELLSAVSDKYRDSFVENQNKFLLPKTPEPKQAEVPVDNTSELQKQQIESYRKELKENPFTKDIIANNKITFGEGEEKFSYPVNADALIDILSDGTKWAETMYEKQGDNYVLKAEHQMLVAAFAQDSKKFLSEYGKHLKSLGAKQVIEPIDNASEPSKDKPAKSDPLPTSAAQAMAKSGVRK